MIHTSQRIKTDERVMLPYTLRHGIYEEAKGICAHCGRKTYYLGNFTVDHIIPLKKGGKNEKRNLVCLCYSCNQEKKSDILDPLEYYKFLPEHRKTQVKKMFENYLKNKDWLSYKNLFKLDQFDIKTRAVVRNPKTKQACTVPTTITIKKIKQREAFDWLQEYKKTLDDKDKGIIVTDEQEITTAYYEVKQHDKIIFLFTPYIEKPNNDETMNTLKIDVFINGNINYKKDSTSPTLYLMLNDIIGEIQSQTFMRNQKNTTIPCSIRTLESDKIANEVLHVFKDQQNECGDICLNHHINEEGDRKGNVLSFNFILFNGTEKDLADTIKQYGCKTHKELFELLSDGQAQQALNERLETKQQPNKNDDYILSIYRKLNKCLSNAPSKNKWSNEEQTMYSDIITLQKSMRQYMNTKGIDYD